MPCHKTADTLSFCLSRVVMSSWLWMSRKLFIIFCLVLFCPEEERQDKIKEVAAAPRLCSDDSCKNNCFQVNTSLLSLHKRVGTVNNTVQRYVWYPHDPALCSKCILLSSDFGFSLSQVIVNTYMVWKHKPQETRAIPRCYYTHP